MRNWIRFDRICDANFRALMPERLARSRSDRAHEQRPHDGTSARQYLGHATLQSYPSRFVCLNEPVRHCRRAVCGHCLRRATHARNRILTEGFRLVLGDTVVGLGSGVRRDEVELLAVISLLACWMARHETHVDPNVASQRVERQRLHSKLEQTTVIRNDWSCHECSARFRRDCPEQ